MAAYPYYYQPYYQQPVSQPIQQTQVQPQTQSQQQTPNFSFIPVPNEEIVNTYPVGPGNCVTFKIEGKPIVMEKSMGFSQFDSPKIERYRLVKEEQQEVKEEVDKDNEELNSLKDTINSLKDDLKHLKEELKMTDEDFDEFREDIKSIWSEIDVLKQPKRSTNKRDKDGDD